MALSWTPKTPKYKMTAMTSAVCLRGVVRLVGLGDLGGLARSVVLSGLVAVVRLVDLVDLRGILIAQEWFDERR